MDSYTALARASSAAIRACTSLSFSAGDAPVSSMPARGASLMTLSWEKYLTPQPLSPDHPRHNCCFNEDGHLCVKNLSAFWLPEFTLQKEIGGTVYTVTGSYDGVETLDKKMERVMGEKFTEKMEDSE